MELSAVGDRVFAAESILKRRVRKVKRAAVPPVLIVYPDVAGEGSAQHSSTMHTRGLLKPDCILYRPCLQDGLKANRLASKWWIVYYVMDDR